ncbi:MAG: hypothetical protein IPM53_27900 [Anaerolineaceae bacterium]|nr:hypothetical protein [Anaerolineaceae bacterium]
MKLLMSAQGAEVWDWAGPFLHKKRQALEWACRSDHCKGNGRLICPIQGGDYAWERPFSQ